MKSLFLILFLLSSNFMFSQSLQSYFEDDGLYELTKYTHPDYKNKINDVDVDIDGNNIYIEVTYDGRFLDYTDKYKLKYSNGEFTNFQILENGSAAGAFTKWLISSSYCDSRSMNDQIQCAKEKCLANLNREFSK